VEHPRIQWFADPAVLAPLALMIGIYVWRFRQVRSEARAGGRRGEAGSRDGEAGGRDGDAADRGGGARGPVRGAGPLQAIAFAGAMLALFAALVSPIDGLGADYLFSAHMVQHVLLGDIAPLLLLLSLSRVILRPVTRRLVRVERALGPLASPVTAIFIWLGTMYLWHIPALYDAAIESPLVHALEHFSFFAAGVALWWPLVQPIPMRRPLTGLQPLGYIAAAKGGLAALGLFLAWSSSAHYPFYEDAPRIWGLNAAEDQNVAGVIMMVEQSLTLVLVMVWVFVRMLTRSEEEQLRRERLEEAQVPASNVDVISTGP
jgi:putative membrane protein